MVDKVARALGLLTIKSSLYILYLNAIKTRVFWPSTSVQKIATLKREIPLTTVTDGKVELLKVLIGPKSPSATNYAQTVQVPPAPHRTERHSPRKDQVSLPPRPCSACHVQHMIKFVSPDLSYSFAKKFDSDELQAYCHFNLVPVSSTATEHKRLGICNRGHGFMSLVCVAHAS